MPVSLLRAALVGTVMLLVLVTDAGPVVGLDEPDPEPDPATATSLVTGQDDPEVFDGRETDDEIRTITIALISIAMATGLMLVGFIWHTSPHRRLRVATRRAARRRAVDADGAPSER